MAEDEIFVQYPDFPCYYGSSYGRLVSLKSGKAKLLKANEQGD